MRTPALDGLGEGKGVHEKIAGVIQIYISAGCEEIRRSNKRCAEGRKKSGNSRPNMHAKKATVQAVVSISVSRQTIGASSLHLIYEAGTNVSNSVRLTQ